MWPVFWRRRPLRLYPRASTPWRPDGALRSLDVREVVEAMDMDQNTNQQVRSAFRPCAGRYQKLPGIRYSKYTWNPAYKGVDDYFLSRAATM